MQTIQSYLPSDVLKYHILPDLTATELLDSVAGTDKSLSHLVAEDISGRLNSRMALSEVSPNIKALDQLFRLTQAYHQPVMHQDYSELDEKPLYYVAQSPKHLIGNVNEDELNILRHFANKRKLKRLTVLELTFEEAMSVAHQKCLFSIFQFSKITRLKLCYKDHEPGRWIFNLLNYVPDRLTHLTLQNADLTARDVQIFKSKKFITLTYLDLSHNSLLCRAGMASIFEGNLPKLNTLKLKHIGSEFSLGAIIPQAIPASLEKLSLKGTDFEKQHLLINKLKDLHELKKLKLILKPLNQNRQSIQELIKKFPKIKLKIDSDS